MKTYSGICCLQDIFAKFVNDNKNDGFVVDIGCQTSGQNNNSTLLLEMGWSGVGADINDYSPSWDKFTNFNFFKLDCTDIKNVDYLFSGCPEIIDFLSIDVDGASLKTLQNINFNKFRFKCICIEHDFYWRGEELRTPQREILEKLGYKRVINTAAEDWYINFELIQNEEIKKILSEIPIHIELNENQMEKILDWLKIN